MLSKEPAVVLGALSELIKAIIPMLIIFGLIHWSAEQVAAVMLVVGVSVAFLNTVLTRSQTVPTATTDALIKTATNLPAGTPVEVVKTELASKQ